jgi:hypothetical protein
MSHSRRRPTQLDRIEWLLTHLRHQIGAVLRLEARQMALIDDVLAETQRNATIGDSVLALIQKLIDQAGGDPVKLQAALDLLRADSDKLEAAVLANTPQEPTP